jgi:hypothetical protein
VQAVLSIEDVRRHCQLFLYNIEENEVFLIEDIIFEVYMENVVSQLNIVICQEHFIQYDISDINGASVHLPADELPPTAPPPAQCVHGIDYI